MDWRAWLKEVDWLELLDQLSTIATAAVAVWAWWQFGIRRTRHRRALERYLKSLQGNPQWEKDQGQRTVVHLMAELRQTEAEVMEGAFASTEIEIIRVPDPATGFATSLLLAHHDSAKTN